MPICTERLLIVEDEPLLRVAMSDALRKHGWTVDVAKDGDEGMGLFRELRHGVVLSDLIMPRKDGMELLKEIKSLQPGTAVVLITAHGTVERAVEAMRAGAADFIRKPFSMAQLLIRLDNVCSARLLREQNVRLQQQLEERFSFGNLIGKSPQMQEVFDLIRLVATSNASVLIHGDSGTGKELVASAIHYNSARRSQSYVRVSCASLPESLIESELFGYEKGAFTGAADRRIGRFEAANGGSLFLDEIAELPPTFQVKLLRVLEERQIERLGSNRPIDIDVRIISASLRPLEEEIEAGRFREDLYFRLNTVTIRLPALSERREDIPLVAQHFLEEFAIASAKQITGFTDEALAILESHPWPGNVRELRNVVERAVLFCQSDRIGAEHLPPGLITTPRRKPSHMPPPGAVTTLEQAVVDAEIDAIRAALKSTGGGRSEAAELLGISRKSLWEKIKKYGVKFEPKKRTPDPEN